MRDGLKSKLALFNPWLALAAGLLAALALSSGCTKGLDSREAVGMSPDGLPIVAVSAIEPTSIGTAENLDVQVVRAEGGYDVSIVTAAEIGELADLYFSVDYPVDDTHSLGLPATLSTSGDNVLGLVTEPSPGHIVCGVTQTKLSTTPLVASGETVLSFRLVNGGAPRGVSEVASGSRARARNLQLAADESSNWTLSWDYTNPGDADQNGVVGINDLTPLGMHFLEKVSNTWDDPLRNIDGNGDGEINGGDITPIGQNFAAEIWAYQIEMSEDGSTDFRVIGQLKLEDNSCVPGETKSFSYSFGPEYVEGAWYRVVPLDSDLEYGIPSEAVSESGRRIDPVQVETGRTVTVTLYAIDLPAAIAHVNAARVIFPSCYEYVRNSANPGSVGGTTSDVDGLWSSFVAPDGLLFPPDAFFITSTMPDGRSALDLNVTSRDRLLPAAPVGYGDLVNFKLLNNGSEPLTLEFQLQTDDGVLRTYFTDGDGGEHFFNSSLGLRVI